MSQDERDYWYDPKQFRKQKNDEPYAFENKANKSAKKPAPSPFIKYIVSVICIILFGIFTMNFMNIGAQKTIENLGEKTRIQNQQLQKQNQQWAKQQEKAAQKKAQLEIIQKQIEASKPHYEQRAVKAKSLEECTKNGVITNESLRCMKDHYETVLVSGN